MCTISSFVLSLALCAWAVPGNAFDSSATNGSFVIEDVRDIGMMAKLILMRDNVIIDPEAVSEIDEAIWTK